MCFYLHSETLRNRVGTVGFDVTNAETAPICPLVTYKLKLTVDKCVLFPKAPQACDSNFVL